PPFMRGLLNLRGSYLPVLDCRQLVGEPMLEELNSHILIAGRSEPEMGLLVDEVREVRSYDPERIVPLSDGAAAPFLQSVINDEPDSILLFALPHLLELATAQELEAQELEAQELEAQELEVPELEVPELEVPELEALELEAQELEAPELEAQEPSELQLDAVQEIAPETAEP